MIEVIAFDADDTLWHNEHFYSNTKKKFEGLLSKYPGSDHAGELLEQLEEKNIAYYGYGIKSFTLSMVEAAIEVSQNNISGEDIRMILEYSKEMLDEDLHLMDGIEETLRQLSEDFQLMIITKGDLFEQYRKVQRSGIADYFTYIEVVAEKTVNVYRDLLIRYRIDPNQFLMVGNSLRSDIQPLIQLGAHAIYVPYPTTWSHEYNLDEELDRSQFIEVDNIKNIVDEVERLTR